MDRATATFSLANSIHKWEEYGRSMGVDAGVWEMGMLTMLITLLEYSERKYSIHGKQDDLDDVLWLSQMLDELKHGCDALCFVDKRFVMQHVFPERVGRETLLQMAERMKDLLRPDGLIGD